MIGRKSQREEAATSDKPRGFDDFDLRLGDVMRGERATLGKSLLDVQRELRIKASYIAAIENCDPSSFDTPGFIAGYVRSYARYLGMDPDRAFEQFCAESGFSTAHGMSQAASSVRKPAPGAAAAATRAVRDPITAPATPFAPARDALFANVEPRAVTSTLVLVLLVGVIGYGGWSVLNEIQRVQMAPVENTPVVLADLDPLQSAGGAAREGGGLSAPPQADALDRLYRPQALDLPVMVARDAPISTLDPGQVGVFTQPDRPHGAPPVQLAQTADDAGMPLPLPQVVESLGPGVTVFAARPSWVRVRAADGSTVYEGIMEPCDTYTVAQTLEPHVIRVGESGAIYFHVDGQTYGPAGARGSVTSNLALAAETLTARYQVADLSQDRDLALVVADLNGTAPEPFCPAPRN